jgi:shikimate dehydrogenase
VAVAVSDAGDPASPAVYGLVGHPVAHSWSPFIHGMFAQATGQNLVYRLFDVVERDFRRETLRLITDGVRGLNVTLPHKQAAALLVNELTARAARAGAVNTIVLRPDFTLLGDNTDGAGLLDDLERNLGLRLGDQRILILGAGGAVRGVIAPLLGRRPSGLVIANRTGARAAELAAEFADLGSVSACSLGQVTGPPYDLIINGTSAGLSGPMPELPPGLVGADTVCYDMAYGRGHTPFTLWARSLHAARITKGWGMLVEQAAAAFALWRGVRPDTRPVLEALEQHR